MKVVINGRRYIPAPAAARSGGSMGERLLQAREQAGYSLNAAAEIIGISKAQLWEMENGRAQNPRRKTMLAIMKAYGLGADVFLSMDADD